MKITVSSDMKINIATSSFIGRFVNNHIITRAENAGIKYPPGILYEPSSVRWVILNFITENTTPR